MPTEEVGVAGEAVYRSGAVARLTVIKQLVDSGHAIGSIAALDLTLLQSMRAKVAQAAGADTRDAAMPVRAVQAEGISLPA